MKEGGREGGVKEGGREGGRRGEGGRDGRRGEGGRREGGGEEGGREGGREGGSERQASKRCASYTPIKELQYIHWEGGREGGGKEGGREGGGKEGGREGGIEREREEEIVCGHTICIRIYLQIYSTNTAHCGLLYVLSCQQRAPGH